MPKITVQVARQRYERVPVTDPETGEPKRILVNRKRRKSDEPIYKTLMENDRSKPLPPRKCERCQAELKVGEEYRSIGIKRQIGGIVRYRCMTCPSWQPWEYSDSLAARVAQIQAESVDGSEWDSREDAESRASELAEMIRELASEKEEGADNIEQGFGHETEQSQELRDTAEQLNGWADEVEQADLPDFPDNSSEDCGVCDGLGVIDCEICGGTGSRGGNDCQDCEGAGNNSCQACDGNGGIESDEPSEEDLEEWREQAADAIQSALDNCPV